QWMARAWPSSPSLKLPTAQALPAVEAATANRVLPLGPGLGLRTRCHAEPVQRSIRVSPAEPAPVKPPTASTVPAESAARPVRKLSMPTPPPGARERVQVLPFQCRISVLLVPPLTVAPAAQAFVTDVAATANSSLRVPGLRPGTRAHRAPFQRRISVRNVIPLVISPTAQALFAEVAVTAASTSLSDGSPGSGLVTRLHVLPFQCRIRVRLRVPSK